MTKEELLNQEGFTEYQKQQAIAGFEAGLTLEQVAFYYKPEFTWGQMEEARMGFEKGLTIEQVSSYYKLEFGWQQMDEARWRLTNGLIMERVSMMIQMRKWHSVIINTENTPAIIPTLKQLNETVSGKQKE